MTPTKQQIYLVEGLMVCGLGEDAIIAVLGMLNTPELEDKMIRWLQAKADAARTEEDVPTEDQILEVAAKIRQTVE